ncbi:hypothetical protein Mlg_2310 [Alkalilimnicola ehrlichii MLHE-1]|uniref:HipA N-terminal subdomain 1 domain-containing protein n=1 Tax=Alkalilimnicola ehrlichii (strain ATCC BAA-1101 / DSM 17681 / MLHE-1) TaxID=187272 RepID=Q0A687_ALKEH|nr:hypothetical protein Mlg_2310 [Alkalilimnicola ehrlichii MLHE-1]
MISSNRAYVWIWLPGQTSPVVAGLVERDDQDRYRFAYGRRYLAREDAISLYPDELPCCSHRRQRHVRMTNHGFPSISLTA